MSVVFRPESAASGAKYTIKHGTGNGPWLSMENLSSVGLKLPDVTTPSLGMVRIPAMCETKQKYFPVAASSATASKDASNTAALATVTALLNIVANSPHTGRHRSIF
jgi:hypothetical protein